MCLQNIEINTITQKIKSIKDHISSTIIAEEITGSLDSPTISTKIDLDKIKIRGWVITKEKNYTLYIVSSGNKIIEIQPDAPRPDVAKHFSDSLLKGCNKFNGFDYEVPISEKIEIHIKTNNNIIHWKTICIIEADTRKLAQISKALTIGHETNSHPQSEYFPKEIDYFFSQVEILDTSEIPKSKKLSPSEKKHLEIFSNIINSSELYLQIIEGTPGLIKDPFSESTATLAGSLFSEINYLIFDGKESRFYIGQNLHTVDFAYFPDKNMVLRAKHSIYNHEHTKNLISKAISKPEAFYKSSQKKPSTISGTIINGISPYHFFYDCIPALYTSQKMENEKSFYIIDSHCYLPLDNFIGTNEPPITVNREALSKISQGVGPNAFTISGVSFKSLPKKTIQSMDLAILDIAMTTGKTSETTKIKETLEGFSPVVLIGISAQKRTLQNQQDLIPELVTELHKAYPKLAIILDGLTSNIFERGNSHDYAEDQRIAEVIRNRIPSNITVVDIVGLNSMEKIYICNLIDFFVTNYSTGSIYPARFCKKPGVAHLSKALFNEVKDSHIHYKTTTIPSNLITDIPDPKTHRIDFVSYSINNTDFIEAIKSALKSIEMGSNSFTI